MTHISTTRNRKHFSNTSARLVACCYFAKSQDGPAPAVADGEIQTLLQQVEDILYNRGSSILRKVSTKQPGQHIGSLRYTLQSIFEVLLLSRLVPRFICTCVVERVISETL